MKFYRIKQFMWAAVSKINDEDIKYIVSHLDSEERRLFNLLSVPEQKHSIRTAHNIENIIDELNSESRKGINREKMIRVGLLHDIGKIEKKINIFDKSILVILNKLTNGKIKRFTGIKKIDVYYNHGEKGYNLLSKLEKYDDSFLLMVRKHHNNDIIGNMELEILIAADSIS